MQRVRVRELALVAVAGGLLAFEVVSLKGALPMAIAALEQHGIIDKADVATANAAGAAASVLTATAPTATSAAVGLVKEVAGIADDGDAAKVASRRVARAIDRDVHRQHYAYVVTKTRDGRCLVEVSSAARCGVEAARQRHTERRAAAALHAAAEAVEATGS